MAEIRTDINRRKVEGGLVRFTNVAVSAPPAADEERKAAGTTSPVITGYAAVFNEPSVLIREWGAGFIEKITPGAFAESVAGDDIRSLWNHNSDFPIGRTKNGSLVLTEDDHGLRYQCTPPATQLAKDFVETIRSGYVDGMSFGFSVLDESWFEDETGQLVRTLLKIKLYEVSPVTWPAYTQTEAQVRSALGPHFGDMPEIPAQLGRAAGLASVAGARARMRLRSLRLDILKR